MIASNLEDRFEETLGETQALPGRIAELERVLAEMAERVARLEATSGAVVEQARVDSPPRSVASAPPVAVEAKEVAPLALPRLPEGSITLAGRTLMAVGGGFLFRALTEAGMLPVSVGPLAGLTYAAWWLWQAERSARADRRQSALFHGVAAVFVAYPLIWETTARLDLLAPAAAGTAILAFLGLGLLIAVRNGLGAVATLLIAASVASALGLFFGTGEWLVFSLVLLVVAAGVEVLAITQHWPVLRWLPALPVDLAVLVLAFRTAREGSEISPEVVVPIALALPVVYLSGLGGRTLLRGLPVTGFEMVQVVVALVIGLGSAWRVLGASGASPALVGAVALALGAASYATAFVFIDRRVGRGLNFHAYMALAVALVLAGSRLLIASPLLTLVWLVLAVATVAIGGRHARVTLQFHGALYLLAAAVDAGLIIYAYDALLADPTEPRSSLTVAAAGVAVVAVVCYASLLATARPGALAELDRVVETMMAALVVLSVAGLAAGLMEGPLVAAGGEQASRAFVATGRTAVLAVLAVGLAWAGRRWSRRELMWIVYPLLAIGGAKLLGEDFRYGQPFTMFMALACYGAALFLTPRLLKRGGPG
jgi:hypothetical protein